MRLKDFPQTCRQRAHGQPTVSPWSELEKALHHTPAPQGPLGLPPRVTLWSLLSPAKNNGAPSFPPSSCSVWGA